MNRFLFLSALLLAPLLSTANAATTQIATQPLLNIDGTGAVKPNLMLLYDNSGSMASNYTPDYINDATTCRARATMAGGTRVCTIGNPPFASSDFNKQYYNPAVRYVPPVTATGTSYPSYTTWTAVPTDGFGVNLTNMANAAPVTTTNLLTEFLDSEWCDESGRNCRANTEGYTYPNDTNYQKKNVYASSPYYYTINVAEYCTDKTLKTCISTAVGAAAPSGYPEPAKVRWCDSTALTNCQAKYIDRTFIYPRFGDPTRSSEWYGTITINATTTATRTSIEGVNITTANGAVRMTNSAVVAAEGTDTETKRAAVANALASSIIAKRGLSEEYTACVRTPTLTSVPRCSSYGITLASNDVVAVIPIVCSANATSKSSTDCSPDGSRNGRQMTVVTDNTVTALLNVSGSTPGGNANRVEMAGIALGNTQLLAQNAKITFARGSSAADVARAIATAVGTTGSVRAYVGSTPNTTAACEAASNTTVCLISDALTREGQNVAVGALTNNRSGNNYYLGFTQNPARADGIPTTAVAVAAALFVRTDIVSSRDSYPKSAARTDCAGSTCTYNEEMTNFANWYAYYRTRNQMMKTAVGHAFAPVGGNYNVGIVSLSVAANSSSGHADMNLPKPFVDQARANWYTALYAMNGNESTPLRPALHAIGKMYANLGNYERAAGEEVVRYPCQQNFTFMTTDGYWNGSAARNVENNDNVENAARFCTRSSGCVDTRDQTGNSLADVALYWYNGGSNSSADTRPSLRPSLEDWTALEGAVPGAAGENKRLHMKTYTLGLGVDGLMTYNKDYSENIPGTDFYKLVTGVTTGCPWNDNGPYVWPDPVTSDSSTEAYQSRVDDLWHAAVNGHGKYYSAADPMQVVDGLRDALSHAEANVGAAAAAATSTPNVSLEDNALFAATFTTVDWYGVLEGKKINVITGAIEPTSTWSTSTTLGERVAAATDTRVIYKQEVGSRTLKQFLFDNTNMTTTEQGWFSGKCGELAQCANLNSDQRATVNNGANIVNWLRGQQQHANNVLLRAYAMTSGTTPVPLVLGDIASSKPAYLREPRKSYPQESYITFKSDEADRSATVFVGANDGMLHAFDATSGRELWAYAPRITMKKLYRQADTTYGANHQFTVDGSPELGDVQINNAWRTVLVGGLNAGGRGYYALDVTDPAAPTSLWEICADDTVCSGEHHQPDMGLTFGNPQFGTWRDTDGVERWVVFLTSGYNNVPGTDNVNSGNGEGWLYIVDVATGRVLKKKSTGNGSTTTPSGLARITAISSNPHTDPLVTYIYGGDNTGRMWRFDFTAPGAPVLLQMGDVTASKPITTRPEVTNCEVPDGSGGTRLQRVVAFGTGRLLHGDDIPITAVQSAYVLADKGAALGNISTPPVTRLVEQTLSRVTGSNNTFTLNGTAVDFATRDGWYMNFTLNAGERVNLDPKIVAGTLSMVTNVPSNGLNCKVGGFSLGYQVDVCTAAPLSIEVISNSVASVGDTVISLPSGELVQEVTGANGQIIPRKLLTAKSSGAKRTGWRRVRN